VATYRNKRAVVPTDGTSVFKAFGKQKGDKRFREGAGF
jgi:hypothetical protein